LGAGYNCIIGLSGPTNAHPSLCNVFSNEIKLCCKFVPIVSCGINFSADAPSYIHPSVITFTYSCPAASTGSGFSMEIEITDDFGHKKIIDAASLCTLSPNTQTLDTSELLSMVGGDVTHAFSASLKSKTSSCVSAEINFSVSRVVDGNTGTGVVPIIPIIPIEECKIKSLGAQNITTGSNVLINYSCYDPSTSAEFSIKNPYGQFVLEPLSVPCGSAEVLYNGLNINPSNPNFPEGVYSVNLAVGECAKEFFFSVTKPRSSSNVPDTGLFTIILSLLVVVFFVFGKNRKK
jgi:hypothetical protein